METDINKLFHEIFTTEEIAGMVIDPETTRLYLEKDYLLKCLIYCKHQNYFPKNYEEIQKLKKSIYELEAELKEHDIVSTKNKQILAKAWSDRELSNMVSCGEFPADQVDSYIEQRTNLESFVRTAPQTRSLLVGFIRDLENELHELKRQ